MTRLQYDEAFEARKITAKELAALDLGEGFFSTDDYTYPVVKDAAGNEVALFHAAGLILADGDTQSSVTKDFNVGGVGTVKWSSDCKDLVFDGNKACFAATVIGKILVTATAGDLSKTYELAVNHTSGIGSIENDRENVIGRRFFNTEGIEVPEPETADGRIYIVLEELSDGSTRVVKVVNDR